MLDRLKEKKNNDRLTLTLTYHLSLKNFQNVLHEAHNFLIPNKEHRKVFRDNLPMIGWRKPKSLKDPLVLKLNADHLQIKVHLVGLDANLSCYLGNQYFSK